jgi:hypothetical protein
LTGNVECEKAVHFFGRYLEKSTESIIHEISSKEPRRIIERVRELVTLSAVTSVSLEKPGKILDIKYE